LTADNLREALGNVPSTVGDDKLNLTDWNAVIKRAGNNKIKSKENIAELIKSCGKGSTDSAEVTKFGRFKDHLKGHAFGDAKVNKDDENEQ